MGWQDWESAIAGVSGGLVGSIVTCPLDVIKTKLQAQHASPGQVGYRNIRGTIQDVWEHQGFRGFYRGLGPTLLGYLPSWGIYFLVYDGMKRTFGERHVNQTKRSIFYPAAQVKGYQPAIREHPWSVHLVSAMAAGAASTLATNPLWVVKTRFMTQSVDDIKFRHTWDACTTIWRTEGPRAFYRGLGPSLLGIAHVCIQFPLYEHLKSQYRSDPTNADEHISMLGVLLCSTTAKMVASIATYPHEVVRTRFQTLRRPIADKLSSDGMVKTHPRVGIIQTAAGIVRSEGFRGLYKGLSVNLVRTLPNSAVVFMTVEGVKMLWPEAIS